MANSNDLTASDFSTSGSKMENSLKFLSNQSYSFLDPKNFQPIVVFCSFDDAYRRFTHLNELNWQNYYFVKMWRKIL
jgi:phage gp37-like protein